MRSDIVSIQPQVVQFGRETAQTIKVVNNSNHPLSNFFFCLYNNEKFSFSPDSFSLAPNQHKLITVTLRLKSPKATVKEFAYLKSTEINKRITLLINQFHSPAPKANRQEEGYEDLNTLSSREYRDVQTQAIQKIIQQKEAYIALLEKEKQGRQSAFKTEESGEKGGFYRKEYEQLSLKWALTNNQNLELQHQNDSLRQKYEQYRAYCENDLKNYQRVSRELQQRTDEVQKLKSEVDYIEKQGQEFLQTLEQKEKVISQLEQQKSRNQQQSKKQMETVTEVQQTKLQQALIKVKVLEDKYNQTQAQLNNKQQEIKGLIRLMQAERKTISQLQSYKEKLVRVSAVQQSLTDQNSELTIRLHQTQKQNQTLKEQIFVCKNKIAEVDSSSDKMNQYLEIALESCRSENDALKHTKQQLEKSLDEFARSNKQTHDNNRSLSEQLDKYKQETALLTDIKNGLERRNQQLKQEHHLAVMKLKTQNIELLERMSANSVTRREEQLRQLQEQILVLRTDITRQAQLLHDTLARNQLLEEDNIKLVQKVKRYKRDAKKDLKNTSESIVQELAKTNDQNQKMLNRIAELQLALQLAGQKLQSASSLEDQNKKERASSRIVGIKDQRKEIQQTQKGYTQATSQEINQLNELRELNQYITTEQERLTRICKIPAQQYPQQESRPLYRCIGFFKGLQNHLRDLKGLNSMSGIKEVENMKGRLRELQAAKQDKEMTVSMNLNRTRQQCSQLLQFVRQEMKAQYKKLNETVKLWEHRHQLLKKKIYEQYRAKIVEMMAKKQKNSVGQVQAVLQRFIDSMANLSHKEAILHKEVRLKQQARKNNTELKHKIQELNQMVNVKKGYCSRDPLKVYTNDQIELDWQETLKREAEFLTLTAEHQHMKEQLDTGAEELTQTKQEIRRLEKELEQKSAEILRLKKYHVEMQTSYETEIQKQYDIVQENKRKIMQMNVGEKGTKGKDRSKTNGKRDLDYRNLKESVEKQKQVIQILKDKEKMLNQILQQTHRSQEKERKKISEDNRIVQTLRDLKDNNRQLRTENTKLRQKATKLQQQLQNNKLYLKNVKQENKEDRGRAMRKDQLLTQQLKQEAERVSEQLKRTKEELDKLKRKREKELTDSRNQIDRLQNENLINVKSLQSVIRALVDTLRKIYQRIKFSVKKQRGKEVPQGSGVFDFSQGVEINALKIDELFQTAMEAWQEPA